MSFTSYGLRQIIDFAAYDKISLIWIVDVSISLVNISKYD